MRKITCKVSPLLKNTSKGIRLDQAIIQSKEVIQADISKALIRKLILVGAVYVNGTRLKIASRILHGGEIIDLYLDEKQTPIKSNVNQFLPLRILYEDEAVICFDKPFALPTQPTLDEDRPNLFDLAKKQLQKDSKKEIYLGMHHRLDRDTSGVIIFTRDKKFNSFIGDQFKNHTCSKTYVALVHGKVKQSSGKLESFLGPVAKSGKSSKFGSVKSGGKKAITNYLVLSSNGKYTLLEVQIPTGRTHQIRVHFSEMGNPIVGDSLYGSPVENYHKLNRHMLHAHALTFEHPTTSGIVRVESPVPEEFRKWVSEKQ